jgi:UDP-N-acetylglucosamine transferase subunit ALG13
LADVDAEKPLVFVTVGTDHHPFDRLMRWVDAWLADGGAERARCLVQRGRSARPRLAESTDYLGYDDMRRAVEDAAAVVTHAGPGSVALSTSVGRRPIVVPRQKSLGEHVDDHQVAFARRIADANAIELAESEDAFRAALDRSLSASTVHAPRRAGKPVEAVRRFEQLVGDLTGDGKKAASAPARAEEAPLSRRPVRVLYIGGAGRSGSTLLDLVLGQIPGVFAAGELKYIWERGVRDNRLCGCGERFHSCPFWTAVGERAFGGWSGIDVDELLDLERAVDSHVRIPLMRWPGLWPPYASRFEQFIQVATRLYTAIAEVSNAAVVVDSTKRPSSAFLLSRIPALDLRFVQLVRDSRGVAFSWSKRVKRPDAPGFMPRYDPVRASARWIGNNSLFPVLARLGVPGVRIRYEALVTAPKREIERIVRHSGAAVAAEALDFLDESTIELKPNHIVAGNPLRLERARLQLRLDDAWRTRMSARERSLVLLLTWPLLLRYGYLRPGAKDTDAETPSRSPRAQP